MDLEQFIVEQMPPVTTLQVFHRRLKIPLKIYLETVKAFTNPWDERACQHFAARYLEELKDAGIVGMVREEHDGNDVYLDVAVRYPINH